MMNKRIRSMVDEIFSKMQMTAENLALRDELLANAQARYEDVVGSGKTEEEAFAEVAVSLEDVHELLLEMNGGAAQEDAPAEETPEAQECAPEAERPQEGDKVDIDLGETLNKAFSALGSFGKSIMPQAKKLVREVDHATGGALGSVGKAVNKTVKDAQKVAGEAIDKMSEKGGELVFDFGKRDEEPTVQESNQASEPDFDLTAEETAAPIILEAANEPLMDADGEVSEEAFTRVVEQIEREAKQMLGEEDEQGEAANEESEDAQDAEYTVKDEGGENKLLFPAAGLRAIDIELDADDVRIESCEGCLIETIWSAQRVEGEPEIVMEGHKLKIRRKNPDVFKTFFSAFSKNGGKMTVRVPHGYAPDYRISTTSGNIVLDEVDVESVSANTASGDICLEPDAAVRVQQIKANTVSGRVNISACAEEVKANTVSGSLFISCDAQTVNANSVSGRIHAEGACDAWEVDSVSGSVELVCTAAPGKKIRVNTVSASATVALPGSIRGFVAEVSGVSGKLINEFGPDRYGTCALPIRMNSMSGSMKIVKL